MARSFGGSDRISITPLAQPRSTAFQAHSYAICCRPTSLATADIIVPSTGTSGTSGFKFSGAGSGQFAIYNDTTFTEANSGTTWAVINEWSILVAGKDAGTVTPRLSLYQFSSGGWTHVAGSQAIPDSTTPASMYWSIASWGSAGGIAFAGAVAALMYVPHNLTDGERSRLACGRWAHQYGSEPDAMVREFPPGGRDQVAVGEHGDYGSLRSVDTALTGTTRYAGTGPPGFAYSAHIRRR